MLPFSRSCTAQQPPTTAAGLSLQHSQRAMLKWKRQLHRQEQLTAVDLGSTLTYMALERLRGQNVGHSRIPWLFQAVMHVPWQPARWRPARRWGRSAFGQVQEVEQEERQRRCVVEREAPNPDLPPVECPPKQQQVQSA